MESVVFPTWDEHDEGTTRRMASCDSVYAERAKRVRLVGADAGGSRFAQPRQISRPGVEWRTREEAEGAESTLSQYTVSPRNAESPECGPPGGYTWNKRGWDISRQSQTLMGDTMGVIG